MRKITYYAATSLGTLISGPDGDISGFVQAGNGVDQYLQIITYHIDYSGKGGV